MGLFKFTWQNKNTKKALKSVERLNNQTILADATKNEVKKYLTVLILITVLLSMNTCGVFENENIDSVLTSAAILTEETTAEPVPETTPEPTVDPATQIIVFKDAGFEAAVRKVIGKSSGSITRGDVEKITELDIKGGLSISAGSIDTTGTIKDISGIEYFTSLEVLLCGANKMTVIDVSNNTMLKILVCSWGELTELKIGNNTTLEWLDCSYNPALSKLDLGGSTSLKGLDCSYDKLNALDISKNILLEELYCNSNGFFSLDVSNNVALEKLVCSDNLNIIGLDENKTEVTKK